MASKKKSIQNKRAIMQVLGCLLQNPMILIESKYDLSIEDFPEKFHQILLGAMINLYNDGVFVFDVPTICNYLANYPSQEKIFNNNDGIDYMEEIIERAELENFEYNYNIVKKFSVLRDLYSIGIDISDIYDIDNIDVKQEEEMNTRLMEMTIDDIVNYFQNKISDKMERYSLQNTDMEKFSSADGARELKEKLKETPDIGLPFTNEFFTTCFRGQRKRKVILETSDTGTGKTRKMVANCCHIAVPYVYDLNKEEWVKTGMIPEIPLFINTELDKDEIQTIMWAYLSGVDENHIKTGQYKEGEEERVDKAIELLEKYPFPVVCINDFDIDDIKKISVQHIIKQNIQYVYFDYIHSTPKSLTYYARKTQMKLQEHQVLFLFGVEIKQLARKYDIFFYSATQGNDNIKDETKRDNSATRGAKSLSDKIDGHIITFQPTNTDIKKLKDILSSKFGGKEPNVGYSIFKNRGGKFKNVYLWCYIDLGNVREECLFVTDRNYNPINMEILNVVMNTDNETEFNVDTTEIDMNDENDNW